MPSEPHRGNAVVVLFPSQGVGGVAPIVHFSPFGKHFVISENVATLSVSVFVFHYFSYLSFVFVLYHILNSLSRVFSKKMASGFEPPSIAVAKFITRGRTATARSQSSAISFVSVLYHVLSSLSRRIFAFCKIFLWGGMGVLPPSAYSTISTPTPYLPRVGMEKPLFRRTADTLPPQVATTLALR